MRHTYRRKVAEHVDAVAERHDGQLADLELGQPRSEGREGRQCRRARAVPAARGDRERRQRRGDEWCEAQVAQRERPGFCRCGDEAAAAGEAAFADGGGRQRATAR